MTTTATGSIFVQTPELFLIESDVELCNCILSPIIFTVNNQMYLYYSNIAACVLDRSFFHAFSFFREGVHQTTLIMFILKCLDLAS